MCRFIATGWDKCSSYGFRQRFLLADVDRFRNAFLHIPVATDKAQFADWSTREDIKSQLSMELTVLLYKNGYPPQWDEEVFEKVLEQAENMKKNNVVK